MNERSLVNGLYDVVDPSVLPRARAAFTAVALIIPLAIGFIGSILTLLWLPEIPDPAVIHWGSNGPDGFGPGWTFPVIIAAYTLILSPGMWIMMHLATRRGRWGATVRFLGAFLLAMTVFMTVTMVAAVYEQRGYSDASEITTMGPGMLIGLAGAAVTFVIGWFVQPRVEVVTAWTASTVPVDLAPDERAAWVQTVRTTRVGTIFLIAATVIIIAATCWMAVLGQPTVWILVAATFSVVTLGLTMLVFRVTVDDAGLTVRGFLGWPTFRVAATDVDSARVIEVNPFADFGGWGMRWAGGRFGIVVRTGTAIEVRRTNGKIFVVTVDDAERGAALLMSYADRVR